MSIINIEIENVLTHAYGIGEYSNVLLCLRAWVPGFQYTKLYKMKKWDGRMNLFSGESFPTGLLPIVLSKLDSNKLEYTITDKRVIQQIQLHPTSVPLREYQEDAINKAFGNVYLGTWFPRGIIKVPTGGGKCFGAGTTVLMFDGSIKQVEDVVIGDLLMGPDSTPRLVASICHGVGPLMKITPIKGEPWVCNDEHILTVQDTCTGVVTDIAVPDYLRQTSTFKHRNKQFSVGASFKPRPIEIDPYFVGLWLGDGNKNLKSVTITKPDLEIVQAIKDTAAQWSASVSKYCYREGDCPTWAIVTKHGQPNKLQEAMRRLNLYDYAVNSRDVQLQFLAGCLDSDAYYHHGYFEICQKNEHFASCIAFVARSLGFKVTIRDKIIPEYGKYKRLHILGDVSVIPTRVPRKKASPRKQIKDVLRTGFIIEPVGIGDYFGFTLASHDKHFLLGDFTVVHNTEIAAAMIEMANVPTMFLVHRQDLVTQAIERFKRYNINVGGLDTFDQNLVTVCTVQSLMSWHMKFEKNYVDAEGKKAVRDDEWLINKERKQGSRARQIKNMLLDIYQVFIDEAHLIATKPESFGLMNKALTLLPNTALRWGLTATPFLREQLYDWALEGSTGPCIVDITNRELIDAGYLSDCVVDMYTMPKAVSMPKSWPDCYEAGIVTYKPRNEKIIDCLKTYPGPTLILVNKIGHGELLKAMAVREGKNVPFISGSSSKVERQKVLDDLKRGTVDGVIASTIWDEGIDSPSIKSIILAGAGKSEIKNLQRLGRGLRTSPGKAILHLIDFLDVGAKTLKKHSELRRQYWQDQGFVVNILKDGAK